VEQKKIILYADKENNVSVTINDNGQLHIRTKQNLEFLSKCAKINVIEGRPFSKNDFPNMTPNNYRQYIRKNKEFLATVREGRPKLFKIREITLIGDSHRITEVDMRVGEDYERILRNVAGQQKMIHDIKVKFESDSLHKGLQKVNYTPDTSNQRISVVFPSPDNNLVTKISVYPKTIQIDIGCTFKPIVFDHSGLFYLLEHLAKVSNHLSLSTGVTLPPVHKWKITHQHLNKDGTVELSGQSFHITIEEFAGGLIRLYSKDMPDGSTIPRAEMIQTPKKPLGDMIQDSIMQ